MTRQIAKVMVRPWKIGYLYEATLGNNGELLPSEVPSGYSTPYTRQGWRLTKTGLKRYVRRSKNRRARRIRWQIRTGERLED